MRVTTKRKSNIGNTIANHIYNNAKDYIIVIAIFIVGIILGVVFINNVNNEQSIQIKEYINNFISSLQGEYQIDRLALFSKSVWSQIKLSILMWFIGLSVIGIPIVLGIVAFRGFCLGYTIAASIAVLGSQKGILFFVCTILLQNILFIPALLALAVSGMKLYHSIMKDKRRENIKLEIVRHTIFSVLMLIILILSSVIETYISTNLLLVSIKSFV